MPAVGDAALKKLAMLQLLMVLPEFSAGAALPLAYTPLVGVAAPAWALAMVARYVPFADAASPDLPLPRLLRLLQQQLVMWPHLLSLNQ